MKKNKRVVIVTGGAQGIGAAIAKRFAKSGDKVVIMDISKKKGKRTTEKLGAKFLYANVVSYPSCRRAMTSTLREFGRIDVVIANAGNNDGLSTEESTPAQWEASIRLNLTSVFNTCKPALPHLPDNGRIIAVSSLVGVVGQEHNGPYGAAKAGILGHVRNLALELAPRAITVNAICPNAVDTPLLYDWARKQPNGEKETLAWTVKTL